MTAIRGAGPRRVWIPPGIPSLSACRRVTRRHAGSADARGSRGRPGIRARASLLASVSWLLRI